MEFVETPAARFENLPGYAFPPHFTGVDPAGLRMHYVDEGPPEAAPVLLLHGEPSWSYLYRTMIPPLVAGGHRVVAPDLVGFGKSSKPVAVGDYSYQRHCDWTRAFIESLDLRGITLFCQDWGSLIGLRLAAEMEPRFARIVVGNGFLPLGSLPTGGGTRMIGGAAFLAWRTFARFSPWFRISSIVDFGTARRLSENERHAYDAPFPDERSKAGARAFPLLVPIRPSDPAVPAKRLAWDVLGRWKKPFLTTFSDGDPITRGLDRALRAHVPGASGLPHRRVHGGHFLQEDAGPELARAVSELIAST
jgi:haloalkane dehalogenase